MVKTRRADRCRICGEPGDFYHIDSGTSLCTRHYAERIDAQIRRTETDLNELRLIRAEVGRTLADEAVQA